MAKVPAKKQSKREKLVEKKVTDFFARKPLATPMSSPTAASEQMTRSRSSLSLSKPVTRAAKLAQECTPTHPSRQTRSTSAMITRSALKRAHSPDNYLNVSPVINVPPPKINVKSPNKRMKKFESDPESEYPQDVIHVVGPFTPPNHLEKLPVRPSIPSVTPRVPSPVSGPVTSLGSSSGPTDHLFSQPSPSRMSGRTRKRAAASRVPTTVTEATTASTSSQRGNAPNPLDALLREKKTADKRNTGPAALRLAEEALKQSSRETSVSVQLRETSIRLPDLTDEQAAWKAVQEQSHRSPLNSFGSHDDSDELDFGAREVKMLGTSAGQAINKILIGDKTSKGKEKTQIAKRQKDSGVSLWRSPLVEDMNIDYIDSQSIRLNTSFGQEHPVLALLDRLYRGGLDASFALLLNSGAIETIPAYRLPTAISRLFDISLFSSSQVSDAAYNTLRDLWGLRRVRVELPFSVIASTLGHLGAHPAVLEELGWLNEADVRDDRFSPERHRDILMKLVAVVKIAALAGAFSPKEVADVIMSLLLIGLDLSTWNELRIQLNIVIDALCSHNTQDLATHLTIHKKVLKFGSKLSAVNKARLVLFFGSGGGRTRHIGQWLAYCLLCTTLILPTDQLPSLDPLILLLSPEPGSGDLFDVTSESMDFEDLGHYVTILTVALADIIPYAQEERTIIRCASSASLESSPSKHRKPLLPLELLRRVLEVIQGKIVDTRAAHLDRSRTKAAIQRLTMRIYYECLAIKGISSRQRTSTLQAYFSPRQA
ncbi:hypothetical protein F5I97DRAFT_747127 [Phlebopus sp. FC_14]|nr:hypothetical protein F5I97DRAFT_747127 [Phlebopus sp. FC_14]